MIFSFNTTTHQVLLVLVLVLVLGVKVIALSLLFALVLMVLMVSIVEVNSLDGSDLFFVFWTCGGTFLVSWCQNSFLAFPEVFFVVYFQLRIGTIGCYDQMHGFFA
jgi:hypothetical protein